MELITKIDRAFAKVEEILLALILVSMVVLAAAQVLLRNIWGASIDWADITVQNATVLLGLLGAAVATSEGRHLNIDLVSRALKGRPRTLVRIVINAFGVYVCYLLTVGGWKTYQVNYEPWLANVPEGWTALQNLKMQFFEGNIPQWLSQLLLPCGFALIGFHFLLRLVRHLGTLVTGVPWDIAEQAGPQGDALLDQMQRSAEDLSAPDAGRPPGGDA
jgi:TRAP-type C4-dicarboxylate transport system permease small subunit